METKRLFIAIPISHELKYSIQQSIRDLDLPGNPVPVENLHITVHFLGETPNNKIPFIVKSVEECGKQTETFQLQPHEIILKKSRLGHMVWVNFHPSDAFVSFVKKIRIILEPGKLNVRITPHITLSRIKKNDGAVNIPSFPIQLNRTPLTVDRIELWESSTGHPNAAYTIIKSFDFSHKV